MARLRRIKIEKTAPTLIPGTVNKHGQEVVRDTWLVSATHPNQTIYKLLCRACKAHYGSNGCDVHLRRCPHCGGGAAGERLPLAGYINPPGLFID